MMCLSFDDILAGGVGQRLSKPGEFLKFFAGGNRLIINEL